MTKAVMKIEKFERSKFSTDIAVSFAPEKEVKTPRVSIVFTSEEEVLDVLEKTILLFRDEGIKGERFADTVNRLGFDYVEKKLIGE